MELFCNFDLAVKLGAVLPVNNKHHKELRDRGDILVRPGLLPGLALFWQLQLTTITVSSS